MVDSITEGEERMIIRLSPSKEQLVCESPGISTEITIIETFTSGEYRALYNRQMHVHWNLQPYKTVLYFFTFNRI